MSYYSEYYALYQRAKSDYRKIVLSNINEEINIDDDDITDEFGSKITTCKVHQYYLDLEYPDCNVPLDIEGLDLISFFKLVDYLTTLIK